MSLGIGDATLQAPVPTGYVRASVEAPMVFATSAAGLPPANRLVEMLVAGADLKRMLLGQGPAQTYLQVQTIRDAERLAFTEAEWSAFQPMLAQEFGALDLGKQTNSMQAGMGERMSAASGADIEIAFGELGKPTVYATRPTSMHYIVRLPITAQINGETKQAQIECVGAVLLAGSKVVLVNAYARTEPGQAPSAATRAMAEDFVTRMQALNASSVAKQD
jgi:hypothetical protein